jgi:hypothetical protein
MIIHIRIPPILPMEINKWMPLIQVETLLNSPVAGSGLR